MPDQQTIAMTVTTSDPMLAAMLRLIAARRVPVSVKPSPLGFAIDVPAAVDALATEAAAPAATFDHDDAEAIDPHAARPARAGIELDLLPTDDDAAFRPRKDLGREPPPADDKRATIDAQLLIVSEIARNPRLADVATHFLKPLAGRGYRIDGNAEAVLLRLANDLVGYQPRNLSQAAAVLLDGKHERFPDRKEVFAAFGEVMKPGARADQKAA